MQCDVPECGRDRRNSKAKGRWCPAHSISRPLQTGDTACRATTCANASTSKGLCGQHYQRFMKHPENWDIVFLTPTERRARALEWKVDAKGYVYKSVTIGLGRTMTVYQHREVMEQSLKRSLFPGENVHHINGDKSNNAPSNLELWTVSQPAGQRVEDKLRWAREFIEIYEGVATC